MFTIKLIEKTHNIYIFMKHIFPYYSQHDAMDCGPACLRMIAKHYGRHYRLDTLRQKCHNSREDVRMLGIREAAENI